jgi:hypothetical protein
MPDLATLLGDTLTLRGCRGLARNFTRLRARDAGVIFADAPDDQTVREGSAVWSWWMDGGEVARVQDVTCKVPAEDVPAHELFVLRELDWRDLAVTVQGRRIALPLDARWLVARHTLEHGHVAADTHDVSRAEGSLDASVMAAFAYVIAPDGTLSTASPELLAQTDFMPEDNTTAGDAVRVVVCLEFVTYRAAKDFDPWGALLAAQVRPRVMVRASHPLDRVEVAVEFERPAETTMVGCTADLENAYRGLAEPHTQASLVTFRNALERSAEGVPDWGEAFDYALTNVLPRGEACVAVDPTRARREVSGGAVLVRGVDPTKLATDPTHALTVADRPFVKEARQGEFDALVLGPPLRAPEEVAERLAGWRVRDIVQAPVGDHDTLYVCWRWGGCAPGVARDQRVEVTVDATGRVRYAAETGTLAVGQWAVVMHHGMAFGLAIDPHARRTTMRRLTRDGAVLPEETTAHPDDAWFLPWSLRYASVPSLGPLERVQGVDLERARRA